MDSSGTVQMGALEALRTAGSLVEKITRKAFGGRMHQRAGETCFPSDAAPTSFFFFAFLLTARRHLRNLLSPRHLSSWIPSDDRLRRSYAHRAEVINRMQVMRDREPKVFQGFRSP
ncbi:hypothetical protein R1flu_020009 [Riccia fluitans]|uniref:Uncharacterized protein n=1 Tax=Riccia fluitans TaxID=41844 RepID=A0ABD1ZLX3_9MARC